MTTEKIYIGNKYEGCLKEMHLVIIDEQYTARYFVETLLAGIASLKYFKIELKNTLKLHKISIKGTFEIVVAD